MHTERHKTAKGKYESDGFYISSAPVIPLELVQRAIAGMDAVRAGIYDTGLPPQWSPWNPGDDPRKLCKIEMPQVANRAIMELVSHPALGKLAAEITGARLVQVWWVQLLYKPPQDSETTFHTNVGWHQDRQYWQEWEIESELFTAWVALSNVTSDSGPMKFVRGSHKWGFLNKGDFYGQNHDAQREEIKVPVGCKWEEVAALLPPGGVSFHDDLTYHSSGPNLSLEPRRSFAIHLRTEKSRPCDGVKRALTAFLHDSSYCPIIYQEAAESR
ncbi:MAG: phytanoyl-CoA dioxygenase family protein [Bacteroidota bacterium]